MATDLQSHEEVGLSELLGGILDDMRELLKQQLALFRVEVRRDFAKTKVAAALVGGGAALAGLAVLLFSLMLVYLLNLALPLWASFGIVGLALGGIGAALTCAGIQRFRSFNPLPDESARALVENVQCLTNPK